MENLEEALNQHDRFVDDLNKEPLAKPDIKNMNGPYSSLNPIHAFQQGKPKLAAEKHIIPQKSKRVNEKPQKLTEDSLGGGIAP